MSIEYCHKCDKPIDTDFDVDHFIEHEEEEMYWDAFQALSRIAPQTFKDMSYEAFIDWVEKSTFEELKEAV